jgi:hypothetical protein
MKIFIQSNAGLAQENGFIAPHNCALCCGWYMMQQQHCAPAEKSLINMI